MWNGDLQFFPFFIWEVSYLNAIDLYSVQGRQILDNISDILRNVVCHYHQTKGTCLQIVDEFVSEALFPFFFWSRLQSS